MRYKIEGAEIRQLTQKTFYELILQEKNLKPEGKPTQERIKETCEEHKRKTENRIMNKDIWNGLKNKKIPFKIKDFIWKLIHNHHKVGNWFKRIPSWEDKAICKCGETETIDHILTECELNRSEDIWQEAEEMWKKNNKNFQWIKPNIKILRGLGAIKLKEKEKLAPEWLNERYIEIVTEITWLIWNIRNKRIFEKIKLMQEKATKKWRETMNNKLKTEKTIIKIEDKIKKRIEMQKNFNKKWKNTKLTNKEIT